MGICGAERKKTNLSKAKKEPQLNLDEDEINKSKSIKRNEINFRNNRINECIIEASSPLENVDMLISKVSRSICKIKIETSFGTIKGTGFLLAFRIEQDSFYCLVSNEHVIEKTIIK